MIFFSDYKLNHFRLCPQSTDLSIKWLKIHVTLLGSNWAKNVFQNHRKIFQNK
jgi:hypothetical protein